jgi:choline dehydrogenase-like flavoprotein
VHTDFNSVPDSELSCDICIIGAGAAGLSCALSLTDSKLSVIVLESGLSKPDQRAMDLSRAEVVGRPHDGVHTARERVFGGTTTTWGGQVYPFMEEDFEERTEVGIKGWPLSYGELAPYYERAEHLVGTDTRVSFDYDPWAERNIPKPAFGQGSPALFVTKWSRTPNFKLLHGDALAAARNLHILTNATAVRLQTSADTGSVKYAEIASLDGRRGRVKARRFVVAGGAMESVRLFLVSAADASAGLGRAGDLVGRYIQDHVSATVGEIRPRSRRRFHELFDPFYRDGYKYLPRLRCEPSWARSAGVLHASGQIVFTRDEEGILPRLKETFRAVRGGNRPSMRDLATVASPRGLATLARSLYRWQVKGRGSSDLEQPIYLEVLAEQEPTADSRITMSGQRDALGMPRIALDWRISPLTRRTIQRAALHLSETLAAAGVADVDLEGAVREDRLPEAMLRDVYHQAGGLIMGSDRRSGVVDRDCRVFGSDNLFVASAAVFPTNSFSNITFTIMALAVRIADQLKREL